MKNVVVFLLQILFGMAAFIVPGMSVAESTFPNILINGEQWKTSSFTAEDFDESDVTLGVRLLPPDATKFESTTEVVESFFASCKEIMKSPGEFSASGALPKDLTFVQMVVELQDQTIYPYPFNLRIIDGECSPNLSFAMPTLTEPFSKHDPNDEVVAVLNSWGMGLPVVSFETGIRDKTIAVEIPLLSAFKRPITDIDAGVLCVHSLANIESSFRTFGIATKVKNFQKIEIQVVEQLASGFLNSRKVVGAAALLLAGGKCGERVKI